MPGHLFARRNGIEQRRRGILRVGSHEPDQEIPVKRIDPTEQLRKIHPVLHSLPIGIDVLPEQRDVLVARFDQLPHLRQNILRMTAAFPAADIRHNAVRTEIVAPVHDRHPRLEV